MRQTARLNRTSLLPVLRVAFFSEETMRISGGHPLGWPPLFLLLLFMCFLSFWGFPYRNERMPAARSGPGVNPKGAVRRNAVESHAALLERVFDFLHALKEFAALEHVVGRLHIRRGGALRVVEEVGEAFGPVLSALDTRMENRLCCHSV